MAYGRKNKELEVYEKVILWSGNTNVHKSENVVF